MNNYLAIITTVLVITQVIRVLQNRAQLKRQQILFEKQLGQIEDITQEDLETQKQYYRMGVECFKLFKEDFYHRATEEIINGRKDGHV